MSKSRAHILIEGKVQGVFFRSETQKHAQLNNLTGWVRNLYDGRVEAVLEGEARAVDKMIAWCHKGPPYAVVKKVEVKKENFKDEFNTFSIIF
jgi:acylphosphatase